MLKVYLAGPIFRCEDCECVAWRRAVRDQLRGFEVVDPMELTDFRGKTDDHYREIVELDKARIDACHILLVNCTRPSMGTSMEILYGWERRKKIYAVCPTRPVNPWLLYHAERVFSSLEDAVAYLRKEGARLAEASELRGERPG